MSRILRRPMFRGGPVDSRGSGITSGLADTSKPKRGLVDEPGGYAGEEFLIGQGMYDEFVNKPSNTRSGAGIFSKALEKARGIPYLGRAVPFLTGATGTFGAAAGAGIGAGQLADFYAKSTSTPLGYKKLKEVSSRPFYFDETNIDVAEGLKEIDDANQIGEAPGFFPRGGKKKFYEDQGLDPETGLPPEVDDFEVSGEAVKVKPGQTSIDAVFEAGTKKAGVDKVLDTDTILNRQNTANEELTIEEIKETLGYKKAFRRDLGDTLGRAAASFINAPSLREGAEKFFTAESASGPGRAEKIETAAATFLLKDKQQTKQNKAAINQLKAKIDYQIERGEEISLAKSMLAATKGGTGSNREIATGIQGGTSPTTGKKFKFAGVVDRDGLKTAVTNAEVGDTFIVEEKVNIDGKQKTKKVIVEIGRDGRPNVVYNFA